MKMKMKDIRRVKTSYKENDVIFLLNDLTDIQNEIAMSIEDKEKDIQAGKKHYSETIHIEEAPTQKYLDLFHQLLNNEEIIQDFVSDLNTIANKIIGNNKIRNQMNNLSTEDKNEIVICSLARAGTPIGILLKRVIELIEYKTRVTHYSISIIRDKGIDENALKYILSKHNDKSIVFVDGWTGKGVIGQQLKKSIQEFNNKNNTNLSDELYVVTDISYTADYTGSHKDYIIPSAVLNSIVSGLISRSILNNKIEIQNNINNSYHGAIYYSHLEQYDLSNQFIDVIMQYLKRYIENNKRNFIYFAVEKDKQIEQKSNDSKNEHIDFINQYMEKYHVLNINLIKPGVCEATRVMLRRVPRALIVRDKNEIHVKHLLELAKQKDIPVHIDKNLLYNAIAIIKSMSDDK